MYRVPSQICIWSLQQTPVSPFVVSDESLHLVVNLLVSQEHSLYPCYLGKIDMAEKYINLRKDFFFYIKITTNCRFFFLSQRKDKIGVNA